MSIQIINLSTYVSLMHKLIVQVALALIYGIFFNSVVPTYLISQRKPVGNTEINKLLFTDDGKIRKITSFPNSIPSKCFKLASRYLESILGHWVKCIYRKFRSVLGLLQKSSWCDKGSLVQHLFQQHDFPYNFYKSVTDTN